MPVERDLMVYTIFNHMEAVLLLSKSMDLLDIQLDVCHYAGQAILLISYPAYEIFLLA